MSNKLKYLILALILLGILMPEPASAFILGEISVIFDQMLGGIEEKVSWMVAVMILTVFFYITGVVLLWVSMGILQIFIEQQTAWIGGLSAATQAGWDFVVSIANMLLIVVFIVIAFAFIFKIETLQAKKALPKLIAIAFLLNFSLLFVNMAIDISQVVYNTILGFVGDTGDFFATMREVITGPLWISVTGLVVMIITLIVLFAIPFANAIAQVVFATLFFIVYLPMILFLLLQMMFFYPLALMFITLSFLFAARVFILQILAIFSPLALISLILPQTKFIWNYWLKTLMEWLFMGVFFLFLLILGFSVLQALAPTISQLAEATIPPDIGPIGPILNMVLYVVIFYFALAIYMAVILYIGKNFLPQGAKGMIRAVEGVAKTAIMGGVGSLAAGKLTGAFRRRRATAAEKGHTERQEASSRIAKKLEASGPRLLTPRELKDSGKFRWTRPFHKVSAEEMKGHADQEDSLKTAARKREVRRRMAQVKDLLPEEHAAAIRKEMNEGKNPYKMEAHAEAGHLKDKDPVLMGQMKKFTEPDENKIRLAKEMNPTLFQEYKNKAAAELSDSAKELQAAKGVIKTATPEKIAYEQGRVDTKMIAQEESKIGSQKFADIATPKMFSHMGMFLGMSMKQWNQLQNRGNIRSIQALHDVIQENKRAIVAELKRLGQEGKPKREVELSNIMNEVLKNPNYKK